MKEGCTPYGPWMLLRNVEP